MPTLEAITKVPAVRMFADPGEIERALALGFRLLDAATVFSVSFAELGDIDLPPATESEVDQANLRAIAPLYLASELEAARLLPAVEVLARLVASGSLASDSTSAVAPLIAFWRSRREHFSIEERAGLFARLFGSEGPEPAERPGRNNNFEPLMTELALALAALSTNNGVREQARLRVIASQLADNLSQRGGGINAFAAEEILTTTRQAIELLKQPAIQRIAGAQTLWTTVRNLADHYLEESPDIPAHVTRGKSGQIILGWLAEIAPQLNAMGVSLIPDGHPAIEAALAWLQVTNSARTIETSASRNGS